MKIHYAVQSYKQKPRRATICDSFLKFEENGAILHFVSLFSLFLHPY